MSLDAVAARRAELERRIAQVERRIHTACIASGRPRADVHLIVVTKYFPGSDVALLADLGVADIGESRDQEAAAKVRALEPALRARLNVHFIGQLQSNKAASLARYANTVHSVDRTKLVGALDRAAEAAGRRLDALVQVSLDGDPDRGGVDRDRAGALADELAAAGCLDLRGVMAVAPLGADPARAFADLREVANGIRSRHPGAGWISAGMSADLEAAVANGATHLRVGSAILGSRPPLR